MEVLSVNVVQNVWFFMELIGIEVLDSNTSLSGLLNMESVGHECKVWVQSSKEMSNIDLSL